MQIQDVIAPSTPFQPFQFQRRSSTLSMDIANLVHQHNDCSSFQPPLQRKGSNLSIDLEQLNDVMVSTTAAAIPRLTRMPSGNSFATIPCPLDTARNALSRVPSGLSELLSQIENENVPCTSQQSDTTQTAQNDTTQTATAKYVYDMSELHHCSLNTHTETTGFFAVSGVTFGPYGPYNPAPSWIQAPTAKPDPKPRPIEQDPYEGNQVVMVRGKYKGKSAFVQRKVNKKYRLQVEGVSWGLEFYSNMFALPSGPI